MSLVSIIVPVYNVENYLNECIESIVNQSYENIEILLINDGSTDLSGKMCEEWAKRDNRINVFHQKNKGLSAARNLGIEKSKGEYLIFIDSDDYVDKKIVEQLLYFITCENVDIVMCGFNYIDDVGNLLDSSIKTIKNESLNYIDIYRKFLLETGWHYDVVWNKIYKRQIFNDLQFEIGCTHEDIYIMHKIYFKSKIYSIKDTLYFYRKREKSITTTAKDIKRSLDLFYAFFNRSKFFKEIKMKDLYKFYLQKSYAELRFIIKNFYTENNKNNIFRAYKNFLFFYRLNLRSIFLTFFLIKYIFNHDYK